MSFFISLHRQTFCLPSHTRGGLSFECADRLYVWQFSPVKGFPESEMQTKLKGNTCATKSKKSLKVAATHQLYAGTVLPRQKKSFYHFFALECRRAARAFEEPRADFINVCQQLRAPVSRGEAFRAAPVVVHARQPQTELVRRKHNNLIYPLFCGMSVTQTGMSSRSLGTSKNTHMHWLCCRNHKSEKSKRRNSRRRRGL